MGGAELKFLIREPEGSGEFEEIARLQEVVWGFEPEGIASPHLISVHKQLGGVVLGAFDSGGRMVAFTYSFFGLRGAETIHWSHMLAVLPECRGMGLGKALKLRQREMILQRGASLCCWTFDPLETANARLNIYSLGAVSREYKINVYGESSGHLHGGLPTDRFVVRWDLQSDRTRQCARGKPVHLCADPGAAPRLLELAEEGGFLVPGEADLGRGEDLLAVPILPGMQELKASRNDLAQRWRALTREVFTFYFDRGYELADVHSAVEAGQPTSVYIIRKKS